MPTVALVAIQALYRQVKQLQQERDALAEQLQRQGTDFQERLTRLEGLVRARTQTVAQARE